MSANQLDFVADIGGTNIRLGIVTESPEVSDVKTYRCADFDSLADATTKILSKSAISRNRLYVIRIIVSLPRIFNNCLGVFPLLFGQNLEPDPPAKIT